MLLDNISLGLQLCGALMLLLPDPIGLVLRFSSGAQLIVQPLFHFVEVGLRVNVVLPLGSHVGVPSWYDAHAFPNSAFL